MLAFAWPAVVPLLVIALVGSTIGWTLAIRQRATTTSVLSVAAGVIAAAGALLIIGTDADGVLAAVIAVFAGALSLVVSRIAVSRSASRD